jgi:shikimate dehydrogenase
MLYGLIGYPLGHSFSKQFFTEKFAREGIADAAYELFPLADIADLPDLLARHAGRLRGLNVTIPHKQAVLLHLDALDSSAAEAGAVNCIRVESGGLLRGFNTDVIGFEQSLRRMGEGRWVRPGTRALVLGTGGAARAVVFVFKKLGIEYQQVTRRIPNGDTKGYLTYDQLADPTVVPRAAGQPTDLMAPTLIVNTTPLGTFPDVDGCPDVPFERLGEPHLVFDLVYNPAQTRLLQRAAERGCTTQNGLEMLHLQAEAAWDIWQQPD